MKIKIYSTLAVACVGLFSGCAAIKGNVAIEEPTDSPRARIRLIIPSVFNSYRGVRGYPNSSCVGPKVAGNGTVVSVQVGFEKNLNDQNLDMPATDFSQNSGYNKAEIYAVANLPISFRYLVPNRGIHPSNLNFPRAAVDSWVPGCEARISFIPEAGADYELLFGEVDKWSCSYRANKLVPAGDGASVVLPIPLEMQTVGACRP